VFIADKLFILGMGLLLDVLPCFGFSRNKAVLFVTALYIEPMWIDAKEGRKTVCSARRMYSASFGGCFGYSLEGDLKAQPEARPRPLR
jgi:hypothetical protein